MNIDTEAEKLTIIERKISHILLKHLMLQRNEIAYIKNNADLNWAGKDIDNINDNLKYPNNQAPKINEPTKWPSNDTPNISEGIKWPSNDTPNISEGIEWPSNAIANINKGIKSAGEDTPNISEGIKSTNSETSNISEGIKWAIKALVAIDEGANPENSVPAYFEQGLIATLNQYMKMSDGKTFVYSYFNDFMEAITHKNTGAAQLRAGIVPAWLANTHVVPINISADYESLSMLKTALSKHLHYSSSRASYKRVGMELLLLHNNGKATGSQLRTASGLSKSGFGKHLPRMQSEGFIKKQPPLNYALTEKSKHILLEVFGIPKS